MEFSYFNSAVGQVICKILLILLLACHPVSQLFYSTKAVLMSIFIQAFDNIRFLLQKA
jgi:hypothetical protein